MKEMELTRICATGRTIGGSRASWSWARSTTPRMNCSAGRKCLACRGCDPPDSSLWPDKVKSWKSLREHRVGLAALPGAQ